MLNGCKRDWRSPKVLICSNASFPQSPCSSQPKTVCCPSSTGVAWSESFSSHSRAKHSWCFPYCLPQLHFSFHLHLLTTLLIKMTQTNTAQYILAVWCQWIPAGELHKVEMLYHVECRLPLLNKMVNKSLFCLLDSWVLEFHLRIFTFPQQYCFASCQSLKEDAHWCKFLMPCLCPQQGC